jgi:drug/metabolite transporter (DMT)-like permease
LIAGHAEGHILTGIVLGIIAALLIAIIASLEKKWIIEIDPEHMTFIQLSGAWIAMCIWLAGEYLLNGIDHFIPKGIDIFYLLTLGLICTSIAWVLATRSIRTITAFDSTMVINLEPVYGIILAIIILGEHKQLPPAFYLGASIIFASVFIHPIWQSRYARN